MSRNHGLWRMAAGMGLAIGLAWPRPEAGETPPPDAGQSVKTVEGQTVTAADRPRLDAALAKGGAGTALVPLPTPPDEAVLPPGETAKDHKPPVYYAVERPADRPFKAGRVYASCSCLKAETAGPAEFAAGAAGRMVVRVRFLSAPPAGSEAFILAVSILAPEEDLLIALIDPRK